MCLMVLLGINQQLKENYKSNKLLITNSLEIEHYNQNLALGMDVFVEIETFVVALRAIKYEKVDESKLDEMEI